MQREQLVEVLNACLAREIMAIQRHSVYTNLYKAQGELKFQAASRWQAIKEMEFAETLIERISQLGGKPRITRPAVINSPGSLGDIRQADRRCERQSIFFYEQAIEQVSAAADFSTQIMLRKIVADKKNHVAFLDRHRTNRPSPKIAHSASLGMRHKAGLQTHESSNL